jgi:XTP/dITP diphosphohydrolase
MKLIFATHNQNKVNELNLLLPESITLLSLNDINCTQEIEETGSTLEENAKIKADFIRKKYGMDCFSDDSGLEVDVLNGAPGVYSARYAGSPPNNEANIKKIWNELKGISTPKARFRTVFFLHQTGISHTLKGTVEGTLIFEKRGNGGFGYDPIFIPNGYSQTFAEMGNELKNTISHRAKATAELLKVLRKV